MRPAPQLGSSSHPRIPFPWPRPPRLCWRKATKVSRNNPQILIERGDSPPYFSPRDLLTHVSVVVFFAVVTCSSMSQVRSKLLTQSIDVVLAEVRFAVSIIARDSGPNVHTLKFSALYLPLPSMVFSRIAPARISHRPRKRSTPWKSSAWMRPSQLLVRFLSHSFRASC